jgi:hypothetical protein
MVTMTAQPRRPRGWFSLYAVAFGLVVAAGATLVASARGFLESTELLWVSSGLSTVAIVLAVAGVLLPRQR